MAAAGLLFAVYATVIALGDSRVYSGSDAGGKAATVRAMVERGDWDPDVGYWAADLDPEGKHHPLVNTHRSGDRWIQVTSLPMIWASRPLYAWFGHPGLLIIPCLGAVLAAVSARRLAVALGAESGWWALWLVGLGTPMVFYAGDFWEHAPAVGLAVLAVALAIGPRLDPWRGLLCGVAGGLAIALRTEVAIYAVCIFVAVMSERSARERYRRSIGFSALASVSGAMVVAANLLVERTLLGGIAESARSGALVRGAGSSVGERLRDGLLTTVGVFPDDRPAALLLGLVAAVGLVALGLLAQGRRGPLLWGLAAAAGLVALVRAVDGLGFVPGALAAAPAGALAIQAGHRSMGQRVAVAAVAAVPFIWLTSSTGLLVPQWGGRYLLLTGALLTVVGAVELERRALTPPAVALVAMALIVGSVGAAWHAVRTNAYGSAIARIQAVPAAAVIVSSYDHLGREAGSWHGERRWLRDDSRGNAVLLARTVASPLRQVSVGSTGEASSIIDLLGVSIVVRDETGPDARQ